jgi:hypothetical protein
MLQALSADARIIPILFGQPFVGNVHSVFAAAVNFTSVAGDLYSLAAAKKGDAPATVRVQADAFDNYGLSPGDPVTATGGVLTCGPLAVQAGKLQPWTAVLPSFPADSAGRRRLATNLRTFRQALTTGGKAGGLWAFGCGQPGKTMLARELALRAAALRACLADGRPSAALEAGYRLLGLGIGLTPAGDDFLTGFILTFRLPAAPFGKDHHRLAAGLVREAATATTIISLSMLRHAADGWAAADAIALAAALTAAGENEVLTAAGRLLETGATSGTDLAVGLATALDLGLQLAKEVNN